jgi:large subunit ribosomal protein L7/L12
LRGHDRRARRRLTHLRARSKSGPFLCATLAENGNRTLTAPFPGPCVAERSPAMPNCRVCGHPNAETAERCEKCLAWLVQESDVRGVVPPPGAPVPPPADDDLLRRVAGLLADGRKIEAVRIYREARGVGLAEAKQAVELVEAGRQWSVEQATPPVAEPGLVDDVLENVRAGRWIHAIRQYRETTGSGLKEAKDAVETLARSAGIPVMKGSGCGPLAVILGVLAVIIAGIVAALWSLVR